MSGESALLLNHGRSPAGKWLEKNSGAVLAAVKGLVSEGWRLGEQVDGRIVKMFEEMARNDQVELYQDAVKKFRIRHDMKLCSRNRTGVEMSVTGEAAPEPAKQLPEQTKAMEVYSSGGNVYKAGEADDKAPGLFETELYRPGNVLNSNEIRERLCEILRENPKLVLMTEIFPQLWELLIEYGKAVVHDLGLRPIAYLEAPIPEKRNGFPASVPDAKSA